MADDVASRQATERVPPLNLNEDEAEYLWEMIKDEIGKDEVWEGEDTDTVRSLHTKIRRLVKGGEDDAE